MAMCSRLPLTNRVLPELLEFTCMTGDQKAMPRRSRRSRLSTDSAPVLARCGGVGLTSVSAITETKTAYPPAPGWLAPTWRLRAATARRSARATELLMSGRVMSADEGFAGFFNVCNLGCRGAR